MNFANRSCEEFIEILASKSPVPGGGGAAGLVGAIGIALGNMVGSLTIGKKKYADVETDVRKLKAKSDKLQMDFLSLMERYAEVFEPLSRAYGMPKETPKEIEEKERTMEKCLKQACSVPLEIMERCCEGIEVVEEFAAKGSRLALSDAGVAATMLRSALEGASLNVFINTSAMKDREYAGETNEKAERMLADYTKRAEKIFYKVKSEL